MLVKVQDLKDLCPECPKCNSTAIDCYDFDGEDGVANMTCECGYEWEVLWKMIGEIIEY